MSNTLLATGLVVHLILVYSIFDIYYSSPIIFGLPAHEITQAEAPARRIFFISADGLRLDTFLNHPEKSPFLHDIIRNRKGVWGTSKSHVPTESRPGHVALFAGFTEDVSAVARGWKKNPAPFDSVFNRSRESWLFGSPDIVDLFSNYKHVHCESYSEDEEDFGSNQAFKLDEWVFNHVEAVFAKSVSDEGLASSLKSDRRIFFLHLLGLDTNGHGNKPHSKEYIDNIAVVDFGISQMQKLAESFFGDDKTTFLFTSDHGMTDWGSHGAGSDEEVLTPFVAWGSGIQKGGKKVRLSQVDIAPLVSSLLGVPVPVNSVGILPIDILDVQDKYLFQSTFGNFLQLKEQLLHVRGEKAHRLWFSDYEKFGDKALKSLEEQLRKLASLRRFRAAASLWTDHAASVRDAIFHYHRYDRSFLGACVSLTFLSWILIVGVHLCKRDGLPVIHRSTLRPSSLFSGFLAICTLFCAYCWLPLSNWLYVLLPIYLLSIVDRNVDLVGRVRSIVILCVTNYQMIDIQSFMRPFAACIVTVLLLLVLVVSFMDRRCLAALFGLLMIVPSLYEQENVKKWSTTWRCICLCLMPFPFFSTVGQSQWPSLCILSPLLAAGAMWKLAKVPIFAKKEVLLKKLFISHLATAIFVFISCYLFDKTPTIMRIISWFSLPTSFIAPLLTPHTISDRLMAFTGALFIPYALLSIAYESFFCIFFIALLALYFRFEFAHLSDLELLQLGIHKGKPSKALSLTVTWRDAVRACVCVCLVICALFGTGNFASLNSFNPSTLHRFISVFSPFTMATLIVLKIILPLLLVAFTFSAVLLFDKAAIGRLSYLVLVITDMMAMCFFHQLRDSGSWLDIGLSISQYVVCMCMSVGLLLLLLFSSQLLTFSLPHILSRGSNDMRKDEGA